jgi:hypothetical protein
MAALALVALLCIASAAAPGAAFVPLGGVDALTARAETLRVADDVTLEARGRARRHEPNPCADLCCLPPPQLDPPGWTFKACASAKKRWSRAPVVTSPMPHERLRADELPAAWFWCGATLAPALAPAR